MSSLWLSANETEVYASAFLVSCILLWIGDRAGETGERRWLLAGGYVAGLAFALHLTALLSAPAALYLAMHCRNARDVVRRIPAMTLTFVIGASAVLFMLVRARHDPGVNQGNPSTWPALTDVVMRRQYAPAPPWPRQAPWFLQVGNLFEYADWQFAKGLAPEAPPSWWRTPITVLYTLLGVVGFMAHRNLDRRSWRAMLVLFLISSLGVAACGSALGVNAGFGFSGGGRVGGGTYTPTFDASAVFARFAVPPRSCSAVRFELARQCPRRGAFSCLD